MKSYETVSETKIQYGDYEIIVRAKLDDDGGSKFDYTVICPDGSESETVGFTNTEEQAIKDAKIWTDDIQHEQEVDFVQATDVFVGKLGTSQDYSWLWDGQEMVETLNDDDIRHHVDVQAGILYDVYAAEYEEKYNQKFTMTAADFEKWSDYQDAVNAMIKYRDSLIALAQLEAVVTPKEVAELGWAKEDTVRDACQNEWINSRKSGSTWLILRSEAKARWGDKK